MREWNATADNVVPAALSEQLHDRMCGIDQQVERRVYEQGQGHVEAVPDAVSDGLEWLEQ